MTNNAVDILNTYLAKESSIVLYWDVHTGWEVLCEGDGFIDLKYYDEDGIFNLGELMDEETRLRYDCFLQAVESKMQGRNKYTITDRQSMHIVTLFTVDDDSRYYRVSCHVGQEDLFGKCSTMLVRIEPLDAEGSYRYRLSQSATMDKDPETFGYEASKILSRDPKGKYALIQFDVVNFKLINKEYGDEFGDEILAFFIDSLKFLCNDDQLYTRMASDVFMILTPYETVDDILSFVDKLKMVLQGYKNAGYRLVFGINLITDKSKSLRRYSDGAAVARQSIKNNVLTHYAFYDSNMIDGTVNDKWIEDRMEKALMDGEFVMYLQPKYDINSESIVGAEALVRWVHPEKGVIAPMDFIPLFEKNGFIVKLDQFMWEEACKCLSDWRKAGKTLIPISVNVSRKHMTSTNTYIEFLNSLIRRYNIDKKYLELEITETMEDVLINDSIHSLKTNGYTLLMDDFGSGYSSLNMLKDTQFDVLKIDKGFLSNFIDSSRGQNILKHTISMSHEIGLDIVAEGVENLDQAEFLTKCGCTVAQGYYYAKPMPLAEFNKRY